MSHFIHPGFLGLSVICLVFLYTVYLIRFDKISAHMAISWIIAELAFMIVMVSSGLRTSLRTFLGEESAPYSLFLLGAIWIVFLMLESLSRISSLTVKLKQINQELALTQERLARAEENLKHL